MGLLTLSYDLPVWLLTSVSDPHWIHKNPDPDFKMNADPDPGRVITKISKTKNVKWK
jgi:hypothetical protein